MEYSFGNEAYNSATKLDKFQRKPKAPKHDFLKEFVVIFQNIKSKGYDRDLHGAFWHLLLFFIWYRERSN